MSKIWHGTVTQNFRLQCYIIPVENQGENAPRGLSFFRSHLMGDQEREPENKDILEITPVVGDVVDYMLTPDYELVIIEVQPRKNALYRQEAGTKFVKNHVVAANLDGLIICQSIDLPAPNLRFIDRLIVFGESQKMPIVLLWTKTDLLARKEKKKDSHSHFRKILQIYHVLPYPNFFTGIFEDVNLPINHAAAKQGIKPQALTAEEIPPDDLEKIKVYLKGKRFVIIGNSGAGKSTIIQKLTQNQEIKIGAVNEKIKIGRHTTTQAKMYFLPDGGEIIDTAGLREFGLANLHPEDIAKTFAEFLPLLAKCKMPGCTHQHEPQCSIMEAMENGLISSERYTSYLNIRSSVSELPSWKKNKFKKGRKKYPPPDADDLMDV